MSLIDPENISNHVIELNSSLSDWYGMQDIDSVRKQRQRQSDLRLSEETLIELVYLVQPESISRLSLGAVIIDTVRSGQIVDDTPAQTAPDLGPETQDTLELSVAYRRLTRMPNISGDDIPRSTLYVGQVGYLIRIDLVAQILYQGGSLDVIDAKGPAEESQA